MIPLQAKLRKLPVSDGLLHFEEIRMVNKNKIKMAWKKLVCRSVDGCSLKESVGCAPAHRWISDGSFLLSGREFITALHVRLGILYSKSRALRGRDSKSKLCGRGCSVLETLSHILQQCYCTHYARLTRHNGLTKYFRKLCHGRGKTVHYEPVFETTDKCKLKPDLVIYEESGITVVDVQIINDQFPLNDAHQNKIDKYNPPIPLLDGLRPSPVKLTSLTLNWRGNIASRSFQDLVGPKLLLRMKDLKIFSIKALIRSANCWRIHQHMIAGGSSRRVKKGVR